jgi:hypothetical protein
MPSLTAFALHDVTLTDDRPDGAVYVEGNIYRESYDGSMYVGTAEMTINRDSEDIDVYVNGDMPLDDATVDALRDRFRDEMWDYACERIDNLNE